MGKSARLPKTPTTKPGHSLPDDTSTPKASRSRPKVARKSNFVVELVKTRKEERRSMRNLAKIAGVSPSSIKTLESGRGPISTLVKVMEALPFPVTGLAPGRSLAEQLRNRRLKKGLTVETAAAKASMPPGEIVKLEDGKGSVQSLLSLLAVIAPTIRRRAPERASWGPGKKAERDSRFTPPSFMGPIYEVFGEVDLDPCANMASPVEALRRFILDEGDDGLRDPWSGRFAFVNPPFSEQLKWLERAHSQWKSGEVETIVCLVPTRTDSDFFQGTVLVDAHIYLLRGRIKFINMAGKLQATPFSLMVVAFGATAEQMERFATLVPGRWVSVNEGPTTAKERNAARTATDHPRWIGQRPGENCSPMALCAARGARVLQVCCGPMQILPINPTPPPAQPPSVSHR